MTVQQKDNVVKILANSKYATREDWEYVRKLTKPGQVQTIITEHGVKYIVSLLLKIELGLL